MASNYGAVVGAEETPQEDDVLSAKHEEEKAL